MTTAELIEKADKQLDYGSYKKAQAFYEQALKMIPSPKEEHEDFLEIIVALGDSLILQNRVAKAVTLYKKVMQHPLSEANAYVHLRYGQISFDTNKKETAKVELLRAYELGGEEIFEGEPEEYYEFMQNNLGE